MFPDLHRLADDGCPWVDEFREAEQEVLDELQGDDTQDGFAVLIMIDEGRPHVHEDDE